MPYGTHRIEFMLFKLIRMAVRRISIRTARRLGAIGGQISYYSFLRRRHGALRNLALIFPELSRSARHGLARQIFRRSGSTFIESLMWSFRDTKAAPECFEVVGAEHMERLLASGKGFIVLGAHFGVWEVGLSPYEDQLRPITVIAKRVTNRFMQAEAGAWRTRRGFIQVLSAGATLKIFRALKRGERAGFIADQRVQPEAGILVPFLGQPAWTSPMMAAMSLRAEVPVLPHFSEPLGADRYRLTYLEPIEPKTAEGDPLPKGRESIELLTRRYVEVLEEKIRERPDLWFWVHDRWRRIKRYGWDSTKERWTKRSGLPRDEGVSGSPLPAALSAVVRRYRRGAPLQRGDCLSIEGGSLKERRQAGIALGRATIQAGRSFRWLDEGAAEATEATEALVPLDRPAALDRFDVVAILLGEEPLEPVLQKQLAELVRHRLRQRRSVAVLSQPPWLLALLGEVRLQRVSIA